MTTMAVMPLTGAVVEVRREIVLAGQRSPVAPAQLVVESGAIATVGEKIAPTMEEEEEEEEGEAKNGLMYVWGSWELHGGGERKGGGRREHAWG